MYYLFYFKNIKNIKDPSMQDERTQLVSLAIEKLKKGEINEELLWDVALHGWWVYDKETAIKCGQWLYWLNPFHSGICQNLSFYSRELIGEKTFIRDGFDEGYFPMNTSLSKFKDQYIGVTRTVNYETNEQGRLIFKNNVRTHNWLLFFDKNFNIINKERIKGHESTWDIYGGCYEDMRIIQDNRGRDGEWKFLGCLFRDGEIRQYIGTLKYDGKKAEIIGSYRIGYGGKQEKNWIPVAHRGDGSIDCIYSYSPLVMLNITPEGHIKEISSHVYNNDSNMHYYRGGSGVFSINNRRFSVIHQYGKKNDGRLYVNRFVELNDNYEIIGYSDVFNCGSNNNIEFISGAMVSNDQLYLYLAVGVGDKELMILKLKSSIVSDMITSNYNFFSN